MPERGRRFLRRCWRRSIHIGWSRHCPVCGSWLRSFRAHGRPPQPDAVCHVCFSKAPHRLAGLFFCEFEKHLFQIREDCVHVAPEPELSRQLKHQCDKSGMTYRSGGLGDHRIEHFDVTSLPLPNQSTSLFYCCHVLNMVAEDRKALSEIHRVLKPGGVAVIQVPAYCTGPQTLEALESDEARLQNFNDPAIYRSYTDVDYRRRLKEAGFHVEVFEAASFSPKERVHMGLHGEVLHIAFRDAEHPVAEALRARAKTSAD